MALRIDSTEKSFIGHENVPNWNLFRMQFDEESFPHTHSLIVCAIAHYSPAVCKYKTAI